MKSGSLSPSFEEILCGNSYINPADFACDNDLAVIVDWREDDQDVVQYVAAFLEKNRLSAVWTNETLEITFDGVVHELSVSSIGTNRYNTLRKLNEILKGQYQIRVFSDSFGNDTHLFLVKDNAWWERMEKQCQERIQQVFSVLTAEMEIT